VITKVRIAPLERWCEAAKQFLSPKVPRESIAGYVVAIETESMLPSCDCNGKSWLVEREVALDSRRHFDINTTEERYRVCEHMLELD
jgi:hypothetical protein